MRARQARAVAAGTAASGPRYPVRPLHAAPSLCLSRPALFLLPYPPSALSRSAVSLTAGVCAQPRTAAAAGVAAAAAAAGAAAARLRQRRRRRRLLLLLLLLGAPTLTLAPLPCLARLFVGVFGRGLPTGQQRGAGGWGGWGLEGYPLRFSPFLGVFHRFFTVFSPFFPVFCPVFCLKSSRGTYRAAF